MKAIDRLPVVVFSLCAGLSLGLSLINAWFWPLVFLGTILSFWVIYQVKSPRSAFFHGWLIGILKILLSLLWFWSVYPVDWLGLKPGPFHIMLVLIYWVPAALTLGVGIGCMFYLVKKYVYTWQNKVVQWVTVSVMWVLAEFFGAIVFSIYTLGPGSGITPGFSFGHTGYALAEHGLLLNAALFGGVYTLSFLVACISYLVFCIPRQYIQYVVFVVAVSAFTPPLLSQGTLTGTQVALVETDFAAPTEHRNLPYEERWRIHSGYIQAALSSGSDIIVLPEDIRLSTWFTGPEDIFAYLKELTDKDVIIIDSVRAVDIDKTVQRAYIYDTKTQTRYAFDKQYLVPQGEYVPYVYQLLINMLDPSGFLAEAISDTSYAPGILQSAVDMPDSVPPVLFCFDSVTPFGVKKALENHPKATFVAHIVSHAWFKREPEIMWHQLDAMLRIQAVYNRIPILQAANKTSIKVYLPNGRIKIPAIIDSGSRWKVGVVNL